MKNVILYHFESVNAQILNNNAYLFPTFQSLKEKGTYYWNYHSSATSTIMVITDLLYGNTNIFEQSTNVEMLCEQKKQDNLIKYFEEHDYQTNCVFLSYCIDFGPLSPEEFVRKNISPTATVYDCYERGAYKQALSTVFSSEKPFITFIENDIGHVSEMGHIDKPSMNPLLDRYVTIDNDLNCVLNLLKESGKQNDTILIIYGDHGDELWGHSLHAGYMHAYEPYSNMINCPLLVVDFENVEKKDSLDLVSTVDISKIIKNIVFNQKENFTREYVFSRNLFAAQPLNKKVFNKSYSVSNKDYNLVLTSKGLSLFYTKLDYYNMRNILDFFEYKKGNLQFQEIFFKVRASHFKYFMSNEQIAEINENFCFLLEKLKNEMNELYTSKNVFLSAMNRIYYSKDLIREKKDLQKEIIIHFICSFPRRCLSKLKRMLIKN